MDHDVHVEWNCIHYSKMVMCKLCEANIHAK